MTERYPDYPGLQARLLDEIDAAGHVGIGIVPLSRSMTVHYGRDLSEIMVVGILDRLVREGLLSGGIAGCHYRTPRHERAHLLQLRADRVRWLDDEVARRETEARRLTDSLPELRERLAAARAELDALAAEQYPDTATEVPTPIGAGGLHTREQA